MRISDWSSDVCSSDVDVDQPVELRLCGVGDQGIVAVSGIVDEVIKCIALPSLRERRTQPIHKGRKSRDVAGVQLKRDCRSEEHTSEIQSLMRISYAVFCVKKKITKEKKK